MLRVRFRLRYRRSAILALLLATLLLAVTLIARSLTRAAADPQVAPNTIHGVRHFYLTRTLHTPIQAPSVCADGYHFASIWEIADPSSLRYNTTLGVSSPDSGEGPPSTNTGRGGYPVPARGWVRTGYEAWSSDTPGQANCSGWGTNSEFARGTVVTLPSTWTGGEQDIGVWNTEVRTCDTHNRVWCVQDDSVWRVYLPVVLK